MAANAAWRNSALIIVCFLLLLLLIRYQNPTVLFNNLPTVKANKEALDENSSLTKKWKQVRFPDGLFSYTDVNPVPSSQRLQSMPLAQLELEYEHAALVLTGTCPLYRRIGGVVDGGYEVCLINFFRPQAPCFIFSFGINNMWTFDDGMSGEFKCQVISFDPSMKTKNHIRGDRVFFLQEGIWDNRTVLNGWKLDSFGGYLRRLGATDLMIDILKIDVEGAEWPALKTAVRDGSLKNVKQLMFESHMKRQNIAREDFVLYLDIFSRLHELGFRRWHHEWWTVASMYNSTLNKGLPMVYTHIHIYYNINFFQPSVNRRNPDSTKSLNPFPA